MARASFPYFLHATPAVRAALGANLDRAAIAAVRAILKTTGTVEIAFQQVTCGGLCLALSSRVTGSGDLVVEIDLGDPRLDGRVVLEADLVKAERKTREASRAERDAARMLKQRRW